MNRRDMLVRVGSLPILLTPRLAAARLGAAYFTNFILTTQDAKRVRFYDDLLHDKLVAINFIYTGCTDICPAMTQNLVDVQKLLGEKVGRDIFMYSITLQPERDTPEMLKTYADLFGVGPGWLFLRAQNDAETTVLRRKLGFYDPDPKLDADLETHIGLLRFGNDRINRWAACPALTAPSEIVQEIGWMDDSKSVRNE
jgi:protein SCO1